MRCMFARLSNRIKFLLGILYSENCYINYEDVIDMDLHHSSILVRWKRE